MATKKKRNKKYHPKGTATNKFLAGMTLSQSAVDESMRTIQSALLRQRMKAVDNEYLTLLAVYFGIGWELASRMEEEAKLKDLFGNILSLLIEEIDSDLPLSDEPYNAICDALPTFRKFLINLTKGDIDQVKRAVMQDGRVPLLDTFLGRITSDRTKLLVPTPD